MKIAISLSGQTRTYIHCHKTLIEYFNNHDVDYFIHSWDDVDFSMYNPKDVIVENYHDDNFIDLEKKLFSTYPASTKPFHNMFSMWYSNYKSNKLRQKYQKENNINYDIVVRCRFDLFFNGQFQSHSIDDKTIYAPSHNNHHGGVNDCFAYGSSDSMDIYFSLYENLENSITAGMRRYWPEIILKWHLSKNKFQIINKKIEYQILRDKFVGLKYSEIPEQDYDVVSIRHKICDERRKFIMKE